MSTTTVEADDLEAATEEVEYEDHRPAEKPFRQKS